VPDRQHDTKIHIIYRRAYKKVSEFYMTFFRSKKYQAEEDTGMI
jgi:hypothetical protein